MRKIKILAFVTLILLFSAISSPLAFAAKVDYSTTKISSSNLSEATFKAEAKSDDIENDETAELKISLELLRAELAEMKSGMKQLQAKFVEAEMEKLSSQLAALQKEIANGDTSFMKTEIPKFDFDSTPAPSTLQVTKIEDFVDFDLKEEISKNEKAGAIEEIKKAETDELEGDSELAKKLESAEAEIAELRAALKREEELGKDKAAHAEVIEKTEEIKTAKNELEKVTVEDAMQKLKGNETEEIVAELKKPSNIIAKTNGEVLFQFPRSLTRKNGETNTIAKNKILAVENLKADILKIEQSSAKEKENNFERSSASKKEFSFFSTRSIAILGGMLGIAVTVFIVWLIRHEQRLLAATSRRFQQLDSKPNFELSSRVKKLFQRGKKSSLHEEKNITR